MTDYVTKTELKDAMKAQTEEIVGVLSTFITQVDDRFNQVDEKFERLDEKFERLDEKFDAQNIKNESRFDRIERKLDKLQDDMNSVLNRLDSIEKDISLNDDDRVVMGMQLNRLHDWVEKAAKKVGVEFVH